MKKVLVTGGGGFVGKAIVKQALARGAEVTVLGRNHYPEVEKLGAACLTGDIRDADFITQTCKGYDTVFHVAALAGIWGSWRDYSSINVTGTENIVRACKLNDIHVLVQTSTPSVVFNRSDIEGGDERLPYPKRFLCHYAKSKVLAEKLVLSANSDSLSTCAIRPHLVWGPEDPHLIPRLLAKGKRKELKLVGGGTNLVDISYVDNVAYAHILAAQDLHSKRRAAGKAYFVSQGEPVNLWQWINELFDRVGINQVKRTVPFPVAYAVGGALELIHLAFSRDREPRMTRFLSEQLSKSHYFSIEAIKQDIGYAPIVSTDEGMERLVRWITTNEADLL